MGNKEIVETVVLFEDDERSLNYIFEPFGKQLKSTKVLSVDYDKDEFSKFEIIGTKPEIGSVYYKHPYKNDTYVNSNLTDFYFMNEKLELIAHIVKLLGAKSFKANVSIKEVQKMEFTMDGEIKCKFVNLEANYKETESLKLVSKLKLKRDFEQDDSFDKIMNYNKALGYIQKYNLSAESSIIGLIQSRDPDVGNHNKYQDLTTELTSEYNSILDFAAGLSVMRNIFNLNFAYNKQFESIKKVNLSMEVNF